MADLVAGGAPTAPSSIPPGLSAQQALNAPDAAAGLRSTMATEDKEMAGPTKALDDALNQPRPERPTLQKAPEPPKQDFSKAAQGFVSTSLLLAGLASAFSRNHITTALNAFGASMKGFHAGQIEQGETAYKEWKQASDTVIQNNNAMLDEYKAVLEDRKLTISEQSSRIAAIASKYKDKFTYQAALMQNQLMYAQLYEQQRQHTMTFEQNAQRIQTEHDDKLSALKQAREVKFPALSTPEGIEQMAQKLVDAPPEKRDQLLKVLTITHPQLQVAADKAAAQRDMIEKGKIDPETLRTMAEQYLAGDRTVLQNVGRGVQGSTNLVALREEVAHVAKEKGMSGPDIALKTAEFAGLMSGERTLGTRTANVEMAVTEAQKLVPLALAASEKVDRTKYPSLNQVLIAGERGTGDPEVVRLGVAFNSVINVYARAISPTGVPTVNDKEHAREILSPYWSKGQVKAGLDQIMIELEAARQAPGAVQKEFHELHGTQKPESGSSPDVLKYDAQGNRVP